MGPLGADTIVAMATRKSPPRGAPTPKPADPSAGSTASYEHKGASAIIRPEVGVQPRFKKRKPPARYAYDPSLAPELVWDGQNPARERGEALVARITELQVALSAAFDGNAKSATALAAQARPLLDELQRCTRELKALSKPFLNWAGKAERLSFEVPTLPLFIHERLSTQAILDSVKSYKASTQLGFDFGGHPDRDLAEQLLKSYEYPNGWFNRMVLGDSLVVMNSLLHYEHMAGQVQMIYIDPPYGVKFGSNFQPFVRKRDVAHGSDADLTREPEMVKAYRDTWELGLHSYLTYLRDRLLLTRELLADSGSVFVQISDENLHHVREVMDEVFGAENFCGIIGVVKTSGLAAAENLATSCDYLVWYGRNKSKVKYRQIYVPKESRGEGLAPYTYVELPDRSRRSLTKEERGDSNAIPEGARRYRIDNLTKPGPGSRFAFEFEGRMFEPGKRWWGTTPEGMRSLGEKRRLAIQGNGLWYLRFWDDFPLSPLNNLWTDTSSSFLTDKLYVVQTVPKIIERCMLMTTDPGDLVIDPTCGSGTTAYVAEQWGRRWITMDTSRVPLALARQRLLTASFDYYELKDPALGPSAGFVYKVKQNRKGEHVGGIVPHVTLKSIANGEAPDVEVLVDRPEKVAAITRVTGPFVFEATIPTAQGFDEEPTSAAGQASEGESDSAFIDRMVGVLQASPILHLGGGKQVVFSQVRKPARSLWLSAEATRAGASLANSIEDADAANGGLDLKSGDPVAIVFGPQHGAVTRRLVEEAWGEAQLPGRGYVHLYVIGFAIEPEARQRIDDYYSQLGIPVTYVQATPDVLMGDLLKNMRSSQIFSVCGQPDVALDAVPMPEGGLPNAQYWQVKLRGLDVFDPVTDEIESKRGMDVPAWFLDTDYNGLVFRPRQAFFPLTGAWDNLKRSLRAEFDDSVWEHLAGDTSEPFIGASDAQIAVKVIDHRGNELMVVRALKEKKK